MPELAELLAGSRSPRWTITLLNSADQPIRELGTVKAGQVNLSSTDRLGGSAQLIMDETLAGAIDWQKDRCLISYDPGINGVTGWPVGVFLFNSPTYRHDTVASFEVGLQSKMLILDQATTEGAFTVRKGSNLVEVAADLIKTTGETRLAATPSLATAAADLVFPTGESVLTVVNRLLEAANYWGCFVDGAGQFVLAPYRQPKARPISWRFTEGKTAIHSAKWARACDQAAVPNRVECFTAGTDEADPIIGVATNTDPASPYSFQARGRWITRREQVEASSQTEADALAARFLASSMSPLAKISISHALVPIRPRDLVEFTSSGRTVRATVQKMSFPIGFDSQVSAEWVEV